jgi:dTDP-D-glucose 4,6-dehydratase
LHHILTQLPVEEHRRGDIDDPAKYHIAGNRAVDNLELARVIADLMHMPLDYELVDCHADNPAHDIHYGIQPDGVPGWSCPTSFQADLSDTVRWHLEHPEWLA